jgi:transposase
MYTEGSVWTQKHFRWLRRIKFANKELQYTFESYLSWLEHCRARVKELEQEMARIATSEKYQEIVGWLRCFRGIDTVTAMVIVSELYGFERFNDPRHLMAFLGLTPSEDSSGGRERRGAITKTGNRRVRRLVIEASWHQRHGFSVSQALKKRREGQPPWVIAIADKAMKRLNHRYRHLIRSGKKENVAITAVAREFVGFIWSVLYTRLELSQEKVA